MAQHIIDATESAGYVPKDSDGPAACLEFEGNFDLILKSGKVNDKLSESGNTTVSFVEVVQDNDFEGAKGAVIYHSFPITGKVSSGPNAGRLNVGTLIDLCLSAGRQDLADMIIGKKFDADALIASLVGDGKSVHVYARLNQQENEQKGRMESKPSFYLAKGVAKYNESKQTGGASFRSRPKTTAKKTVGAPASAATAGTQANGAVATDDMLGAV